MNFTWWLVFGSVFAGMEFMAWFLHKYVMHGPLWLLHKDHHVPVPNRSYQLNDFFALVFAVPSFLSILFDRIYSVPLLGATGFGIMAYGAVYFYVHEVVIHRRWKLWKIKNHWYLEALNSAHKIHHSCRDKLGSRNFGMLAVSPKYFQNARRRCR